jgi:coenzyme PQQ biosynthesis protein PqqD
MTETATYRLARGIRLRREADGSVLMLVPEGIITLNDTAYAALELADGERSVVEIARLLAARFEAPDGALETDVADLFGEFTARGYLLR